MGIEYIYELGRFVPVAYAYTGGSCLSSYVEVPGVRKVDKTKIKCWYCGGANHIEELKCVHCGGPLMEE